MGTRSKHVSRKQFRPDGRTGTAAVKLTAKQRLTLQVKMHRRQILALGEQLANVTVAFRNDLMGLEIDLDAAKMLLITTLGVTEPQWEAARVNAIGVYEMRVACQCVTVGLRLWAAEAPPRVHELLAELERFYHPERHVGETAAAHEGGSADAGERSEESDGRAPLERGEGAGAS